MTKIIENFDISLCEQIVVEQKLIEEIFVHLIFSSVFVEGEVKGIQSPSYALKSSAFKLILMLVRRSSKLMLSFLQDCFIKLTQKFKKKNEWNYVPPSQSQRAQSFVGLRNLGCICYMNSILQQFFNVPSFRYQLLSVDDGVAEDIQEYKGKTAQCLELLEGIESMETANDLVKNSLQTTFEEVQRETKALLEKHQ